MAATLLVVLPCLFIKSLFKLQNLLFFNIKDGLRSMNLMNDENNIAVTNPTNEQDKLIRDLLIEIGRAHV